MAKTTLQAQIDAARAYEELMVPALFGEWAPTVAEAAQIQAGESVLDVACGTGILAREALSRTGAAELVTGLDPSAGMLEVARQLAPGVEWRQGVLGDRRNLEMLFSGAGVEAVEVATGKGTARFPSVRVMVEADLIGWLPVMGVVLTEEQIAGILQAAEQALSQYATGDGSASFGTSAHIVTGTKP